MNKIVINASNFSKGASETDFYPNAGYSPADKGANIYASKGLLSPQMSLTEKTGVSYKTIGTEKSTEAGEIAQLGVNTANDDGYVYSLNPINGTATQKLTDSTKNYQLGISDIKYYKGNFYVTSTTDVALIPANLSTITPDYWTGAGSLNLTALGSTNPHPMLILDDILYIADGNKIHIFNGSTGTYNYHTLEAGDVITSWVIQNNRFYISTKGNFPNKVIIWDGISPQHDDQFPVKETVNSMYVFNGQLLAFLETYVAYWNGITLKKIYNCPATTIYKHQISQYQDLLFFPHGTHLVCYDGQYIFYPYSNSNSEALSSYLIDSVFIGYLNYIVLNINNKNYFTTVTRKDGVSYWRSNRYSFGQNEYIRKVAIELGEVLDSGSEIEFYFYDHNGVSQTIGTMTYATDGAITFKEFNYVNIKAYSCQPRVYWKANGKPIRTITIFHEASEQPGRKS